MIAKNNAFSRTVFKVGYCLSLFGVLSMVDVCVANVAQAYISANISSADVRGSEGLRTDGQNLHISTSSDIYGWTVTAKAGTAI